MRAAFCMLALVAALGCTHSRVADHWGEAQGEVVDRMVANPDAEQAPAVAVEALDADTTEAVVEKYVESQGEKREASRLPSIIQIETGGSR